MSGPTGTRVLAARAVGGAAAAAATTVVARSREIHPVERQVFHSINELPAALLPPVFVVMQAGNYGASFVAAEVLRRAGRPRLAVAAAASGTAAWLACKAVKRWVGRGRPTAHLDGVTTRGPDETGLGFPSGHSAVSFTLAALAAPTLPPRWRPLVFAGAGTVAWSRLYVGAHLPLDVVGGAGIGLCLGSVAALVEAATRPGPTC